MGTRNTEFMDLNDDTIEAIFMKLPPNDMYSLSSTCKRLYELAAQYHHRMHRFYSLVIRKCHEKSDPEYLRLSAEPIIFNGTAYVRYIRDVTICMYNYVTYTIDIFHLLKSQCIVNLRVLNLHRCVDIANEYGEIIQAELGNLEVIKFENCRIQNIYGTFLKHCTALKQITIKVGNNHQYGCSMDWTEHNYPELKSFTYYAYKSNLNIRHVEEFLRNNPQITNISYDNDEGLIELLIQQSRQLDFLHLKCKLKSECTLDSTTNALQTYCSQGLVKRLEMTIQDGCALFKDSSEWQSLANLAEFQGLHCNDVWVPDDLLGVVDCFPHLKVISISFFSSSYITTELINALSCSLPNLEELHLQTWPVDLYNCIEAFVSAPKMHTISIRGSYNVDEVARMGFQQLIPLCRQITNAKNLTIYLDPLMVELVDISNYSGPVQFKSVTQLLPLDRKIY